MMLNAHPCIPEYMAFTRIDSGQHLLVTFHRFSVGGKSEEEIVAFFLIAILFEEPTEKKYEKCIRSEE